MQLDETNANVPNEYRAGMKKKKKEREKNREQDKPPVEEEALDVRIARQVKYGRIMYWTSFAFTVTHAFLMVAFQVLMAIPIVILLATGMVAGGILKWQAMFAHAVTDVLVLAALIAILASGVDDGGDRV